MNSKDWLIISVLTFFTIAVWTVYDIYHTAVTSTVTEVQTELTKPLNPQFDLKTLQILKDKTN